MSEPSPVGPLRLGSLALDSNLVLAPMAGFTNLAFRSIVKRIGGCGLVWSEMVAALAQGGVRRDARFAAQVAHLPDERPLAMQVYGREPGPCAALAAALVEAGAAAVDLNCGCPVRKAKEAGCGVALMREPERVAAIIAAMRAAVRVPLGVKIRLGFDAGRRNGVEVARAAVDAGVDFVCVHLRTGEHKHAGDPDLAGLAEVRAAVQVPLIANGSLDTPARVRHAISDLGADGVMIGRSACADPWIFHDLMVALSGGTPQPPGLAERRRLLHEHYALLCRLHDEVHATRIMRKYAHLYTQGLPGVRAFRNRFVRIATAADFVEVVDGFFAGLAERGAADSPNQG